MSSLRLLTAATAVVAVGAVWWVWPRRAIPHPPPPESAYVNPSMCAACHLEIWKTYRETGMGRSFSRPPEGQMVRGAYYHEASDRHYEMVVRDGRLTQRRYQVGPGGKPENVVEKQVDYIVGSGNHSRSYLHRTPSGKLTLLPLAWYSENGGFWAMSPGYDRPDHQGFRRVISFDCMFCHNGYPAGMEQARVGDDPVFPAELPEGIDCQRCHGPGRAHAETAAARQPAEKIRAAIVNPGRLPRDRQLEVCMQCHLETTSRTLPYSVTRYDRGFFSYVPGQPLAAYSMHFDRAEEDDSFEIAHAAYRLRKSACFRQSGTLICTTCHDPHDIPRGAAAARHYRQVCQSCHDEAHHADQNCSSCHMPKRRTDDVVQVVMTDHFIRRVRPNRDLLAPLAEHHDTAETAYRGEVVPYYPERLDDELYLAVAQVNEGSNLAAGVPRLETAIAHKQPPEAMFYFELAEALWKSGQTAEAARQYREALRRRPDLLPAIRNLGAALIEAGDPGGAAEVLARAPNDPAALSNLGDAYRRQGLLDNAGRAYRAAITRDPDLAEAHHGLARTLAAKGDVDGSQAELLEAIRIRPDYAEAHYNLGTALGQQGAFAEAERHLLLAVQYDPSLADAYNNLGMVAAARGHLDTAVQRFRKAVEVDPENASFRANLERALADRR